MENTKKQIGVASISETNDVLAPIPEAKKKAGTEPSSERAEKVIQLLQKHITLHSIRGHGVFNITSFEEIAREILSLFPEPVLTTLQKYIDDNDVYRVEFGHYEDAKWIPLKTHRISIREILCNEHND